MVVMDLLLLVPLFSVPLLDSMIWSRMKLISIYFISLPYGLHWMLVIVLGKPCMTFQELERLHLFLIPHFIGRGKSKPS